ncbi:MAG: NYN domain-containing protein [Filifactoraceae bacterium]
MDKSKKEVLIVDGYNVINAWEHLNSIGKENLNEARDKLNNILAEYLSYKGIDGYVVYDAYNVKSSSYRKETIGNLYVVYTKENQTADSYIEKFLNDFQYKRQHIIRVATDDSSVQNIVLGNGGSRISTRELYLEMNSSSKDIKSKTLNEPELKTTWDKVLDKEILLKLDKMRKE